MSLFKSFFESMYTRKIDARDDYILGGLTLERKKPWSKPYKTKQIKLKNYTQVTSRSVILPHKTKQKDFLLSVVSSNEKASSLLKNTCVRTAFAIPSHLPLDWLPLINPLPYQKKGVKIALCSSQLLAGYWAACCLLCPAEQTENACH